MKEGCYLIKTGYCLYKNKKIGYWPVKKTKYLDTTANQDPANIVILGSPIYLRLYFHISRYVITLV